MTDADHTDHTDRLVDVLLEELYGPTRQVDLLTGVLKKVRARGRGGARGRPRTRRSVRVAVAAAACLLACVAGLLAWRSRRGPPVPVATVQGVDGAVEIVRGAERLAATAAPHLIAGDELAVGDGASLALGFADGWRVTLDGRARLKVSASGTDRRFEVASGRLTASSPAAGRRAPLALLTPLGTAELASRHAVVSVAADRVAVGVEGGDASFIAIDGARTAISSAHFAVARRGVPVVCRPFRVRDDVVALYTFRERRGRVVPDVSAVGEAMDIAAMRGTDEEVRWTADGLRLAGRADLVSTGDGAKVLRAARAGRGLTLEMWVKIEGVSGRSAFLLGWAGGGGCSSCDKLISVSGGSMRPIMAPPRGMFHQVIVLDAAGSVTSYVQGKRRSRHRWGGIPFKVWPEPGQVRLGSLSVMRGYPPGISVTYALVAVYGRALTKAEIGRNFRAGARPMDSPQRSRER
jgi:hypothetical protein